MWFLEDTPILMGSNNLRLFEDEDELWKLIKRLTRYALGEIENHVWRGELDGEVPGGITAWDIAVEAITDVSEGKRAWDQERYPSAYKHLCWIVKSKISNLCTSSGNTKEIRDTAELLDEEVDTDPSPPDVAEEQAARQKFKDQFKDDPPLYEMVEAIVDCGFTERADIAAVLGISPDEVTNRRKKLKRRLELLINPRLLKDKSK